MALAEALIGAGRGVTEGLRDVHAIQGINRESEEAPLRKQALEQHVTATGLDLEQKKRQEAMLKAPWDPEQGLMKYMADDKKEYVRNLISQLPDDVRYTQQGKMMLAKGMESDIVLAKASREALEQFGNSKLDALDKQMTDLQKQADVAEKSGNITAAKQYRSQSAELAQQIIETRTNLKGGSEKMDAHINDLSVDTTFRALTENQKKKAQPVYNLYKTSMGDEKKEALKDFNKLAVSFGKAKVIDKIIQLGDKVMITYTDESVSYLKKGKLPVEHAPTKEDKSYSAYAARIKKQGKTPMDKDQWDLWTYEEKQRVSKKYGKQKGGAASQRAGGGTNTEAQGFTYNEETGEIE